jgi:hypothetical protein
MWSAYKLCLDQILTVRAANSLAISADAMEPTGEASESLAELSKMKYEENTIIFFASNRESVIRYVVYIKVDV